MSDPSWLISLRAAEGDSEANDAKQIIAWIDEVQPGINYIVAWCAACMHEMLRRAGFTPPDSLLADSYHNYGKNVMDQKPWAGGTLLEFQWKPGMADAGGHHITCLDSDQTGVASGYVVCIGGNQHHMIKRSIYPVDCIVAARWPET